MALPTDPAAREEALARRKAAEEESLLREVDDAVRQDDLSNFGRRYGVVVGVALAVVLVAFGGYLYWNHHRDRVREEQSETLVSALDKAQANQLPAASQAVQPLLQDATPGAGASARLLAAGAAIEAGDTSKGAELLSNLADDAGAPQAMRDLAKLRLVALRYDQMDKAAVVRDLAPLARPGSPWFGSAGELTGTALLEQGKREEAGRLFAQIAQDEKVPESIRSRARQMAGVMGVDAIGDADKFGAASSSAETPGEAGA